MMKVVFSRPVTTPKQANLPSDFEQIANESDLSHHHARYFARFGRHFEWPARLSLTFQFLKARKRSDVIVSGRYGEYFALFQSFWPFKKKPHLLLDIEWLHVRGTGIRNALSRWLHKRMISAASKIQVFCHAEAQNYAQYFSVDEAKFVWIPYCADRPTVSARVDAGDYLFTSGFHQRDYATLFSAVSSLPVEVWVAAPKSAFDSLKVPSNVRLLGQLSNADYENKLASCRFVVLSLQPNLLRFSGVITYVTAMRMGKCVVVNDLSGAASYIDHGQTGFLVPPSDPMALRECIRTLLGDPETVRKVESEAKRVADEQFSAKNYFSYVTQNVKEVL